MRTHRLHTFCGATLAFLATMASIISPIRDYFGWESSNAVKMSPSVGPTLPITEPGSDARIYGCITVKGTGKIPNKKALWVAHRVVEQGNPGGPYYTFREAKQSEEGLSWSTQEHYVGTDNNEQWFVLYAFIVPIEMNRFLYGVLGGDKSLEEGGNLSSNILPPHASVVNQVRILRLKGTCRK